MDGKFGSLTVEGGVVTGCDGDAVRAVIPEGVVEVAEGAFAGCASLSSFGSESAAFLAEGGCLFDARTGRLVATVCGAARIPARVRSLRADSLANCTGVEFEPRGRLRSLPRGLVAADGVLEAVRAEVSKNKAKRAKVAAVAASGAGAVVVTLVEESGADGVSVVPLPADRSHRVVVAREPCGMELRLLDSRLNSWRRTLPDFLAAVRDGVPLGGLLERAAAGSLEVAAENAVRFAVLGIGRTKILPRRWPFWEMVRSVFVTAGVSEFAGLSPWRGHQTAPAIGFGGTVAEWGRVEGRDLLLDVCSAWRVSCSDGVWERPPCRVVNGTLLQWFDRSSSAASVPGGISRISCGAFWGCRPLASVSIPPCVERIDSFAFYECRSLSRISFGGTVEEWSRVYKGVNWNGEGAGRIPAVRVQCADGEAEV